MKTLQRGSNGTFVERDIYAVLGYTWIKRKITSDETRNLEPNLRNKNIQTTITDEQNTAQFCIYLSMSFRNTAHRFVCGDFIFGKMNKSIKQL